jgi:hypothetical protein
MKRVEFWLYPALAALFVYIATGYMGFMQDDAYIFARYAQNLADGKGFVYNAGEYTEGVTSLLWTIMAAVAAKAGADIPQFLKYAGLVFSALWVVVFIQVCRQWIGNRPGWFLPALIFVSFPAFGLWAQAGLETGMFGFLMMTAFYLTEAFRRHARKSTIILLTLVSVGLILTRPEGLPVILLLAFYLTLSYTGEKKYQSIALFPVTSLAVLAAITLFRYLYFDDLVPNTYYAKGGGGYYLRRLGLGRVRYFSETNWNGFFLACSLLALLFKSKFRILLLVVPMWIVYFINSGGDILPEHRLLLPAVPFMILGTFYFLEKIRESAYGSYTRSRIFTWVTVLIAVLFLFKYYDYYQKELIAYNTVISALEGAHGDIGRYLDSAMTERDKAIITDAGMTAYYARDKHMVDWLGLCDKRVAQILYNSGYNEWAMHYCPEPEKEKRKQACFKAMNAYFEELSPRFAVLNLYLNKDSSEVYEMRNFRDNLPDTLTPFILGRVSFGGYFGVFTEENKARNYKPVLVKEYNPFFWMVVIEKPGEQKSLPGKEALTRLQGERQD